VRHFNVIRMEFNLNSSSKHLIEVDVCNCIFVPFWVNGACYQIFKSSGILRRVDLQMDTDLSERPTASTFWIKQSEVCFSTAVRTSSLALTAILFKA